jgi:Leucine-rich repeat (LRR) protein
MNATSVEFPGEDSMRSPATIILQFIDLAEHIVDQLKLFDLVHLLSVNHTFSDLSRVRIAKLWPSISPLLYKPFYLKLHNLLQHQLCLSYCYYPFDDCILQTFSAATALGALENCTFLNLQFNIIGDAGVIALADACAKGALPHCKWLDLSSNKIGDDGVSALLSACVRGALQHCKYLSVGWNRIGDAGMTALAQAINPVPNCGRRALTKCTSINLGGNMASPKAKYAVKNALNRRWLDGDFLATHSDARLDMSGMNWGDTDIIALSAALEYCHAGGALANCQTLWLQNNNIGDTGLASLADACARGALSHCIHLYLYANKIGDSGLKSLADKCGMGALSQCQTLYLHNNKIGDAGLTALASACTNGGALSQLKKLLLHNNQIGDKGLETFSGALTGGILTSLESLYIYPDHSTLKAACEARDIELIICTTHVCVYG